MNPSLSELKFKWPWRPSQERVINEIAIHLSDSKLHLVAAPGAGKTSLGLEVFRMLGKSALVLSPTRTIRDQWVKRLTDFTPNEVVPDWVSKDLRDPKYFTSITYQALHTIYRDTDIIDQDEEDDVPGKKELDLIIDQLLINKVETLILDEAHHLTQEWWRALIEVTDAIDGMTLLSLTATPPYDVINSAWNRYQDLCGTIDEEISVPELVKSGTLCPHQDYVWAVEPLKKNKEFIRNYDSNVREAIKALKEDKTFENAVLTHPWLDETYFDFDEILGSPEQLVSLLVFLKAKDYPVPIKYLALLDCSETELPSLDKRWWQVLVHHYLFFKDWRLSEKHKAYRKQLAQDLRSKDLLWKRELRFETSRKVKKEMSMTSTKIDACYEIYELEREARGEGLRQVVLTDFIKENETNELGAFPVFKKIATKADDQKRIALLTGRMAVLHKDLLDSAQCLAGELEVKVESELLDDFVQVSSKSGSSANVKIFTELLEHGDLHVIVGTHALLGEGWDAPVINSLVLASYVGSFVLTNQMRGRAIRSYQADPNKVSSIWHIVAFDPESESGHFDYEDLERRFESFVGLSNQSTIITSGILRLGLPKPTFYSQELKNKHFIKKFNRKTLKQYKKLDLLADRWQEAINIGHERQVVPSAQVYGPPWVGPLTITNTLKYSLYIATSSFSSYLLYDFGDNAIRYVFIAILAIWFFRSLPRFFRYLILLFKTLPVDGYVYQMGQALKDSLCELKLIKTDPKEVVVFTDQEEDGSVVIALRGAKYYEKALFSDCMKEILSPIENPRYIISREGMSLWGRVEDTHAVPQPLAEKKEKAMVFYHHWHRNLGKAELIYTRTAEGRKKLLKARMGSFSGHFQSRTKRTDRWI